MVEWKDLPPERKAEIGRAWVELARDLKAEEQTRLAELMSLAQTHVCATCGGALVVRDTRVVCVDNPAHEGHRLRIEA